MHEEWTQPWDYPGVLKYKSKNHLPAQPATLINCHYLLKTHYIPGEILGTLRIPTAWKILPNLCLLWGHILMKTFPFDLEPVAKVAKTTCMSFLQEKHKSRGWTTLWEAYYLAFQKHLEFEVLFSLFWKAISLLLTFTSRWPYCNIV